MHSGWHGGGAHWAGGWRPGWHGGWGWRRPLGWAAVGALGYATYDYGYGYDCPLTRHAVWNGYGYQIVWTRSCDYYY